MTQVCNSDYDLKPGVRHSMRKCTDSKTVSWILTHENPKDEIPMSHFQHPTEVCNLGATFFSDKLLSKLENEKSPPHLT